MRKHWGVGGEGGTHHGTGDCGKIPAIFLDRDESLGVFYFTRGNVSKFFRRGAGGALR